MEMYNKQEHFLDVQIELRGTRRVRTGRFYCILTRNWYTTLRALANNIRSFGLTVEQYYEKYYKTEEEGRCFICNANTTFNNILDGYNQYCSDYCYIKTEQHRNIVRNRFKNRATLNKFRERKRIWYESLSPEEKRDMNVRRVQTLLKNNGTDYFQRFGRIGSIARHEKERRHPHLREKAIAKALAAKRNNNSFRSNMSGRIYTLRYDNKDYRYQGYEDLVIKFLVDRHITFESFTDVRMVPFDCASGYYRPDFYLPDYDLYIDVKSERTIAMKVEKLAAKQKAVLNTGSNFCYFVIDSKTISRYKDSRILCEQDIKCLESILDMSISSRALKEEGSTTIPRGSTLQAFGSGSTKTPVIQVCDIV